MHLKTLCRSQKKRNIVIFHVYEIDMKPSKLQLPVNDCKGGSLLQKGMKDSFGAIVMFSVLTVLCLPRYINLSKCIKLYTLNGCLLLYVYLPIHAMYTLPR